MPLEIKCHTVPHLKALTCGIEYRSCHGQVSIFSWQKYSFYFIKRSNDGFIGPYLYIKKPSSRGCGKVNLFMAIDETKSYEKYLYHSLN